MAQTASQSLAVALSGLAFRNNLNTILAALFSGSSGASAPSPTVQGQPWLDTGVSPPVLRVRNTANTAWLVVNPETIVANTLRGNPTGSAAAVQDVSMTQLLAMLNIGVSGAAPLYPARAWVNFNGTGTIAIRASGNVSSLTDNAVGDYNVNFTTALADANGALFTSAIGALSVPLALTTAALRINTFSNAFVNTDYAQIHAVVFR